MLFLILTPWIAIYPVDRAIQYLNKRSLEIWWRRKKLILYTRILNTWKERNGEKELIDGMVTWTQRKRKRRRHYYHHHHQHNQHIIIIIITIITNHRHYHYHLSLRSLLYKNIQEAIKTYKGCTYRYGQQCHQISGSFLVHRPSH